MKKEFAMTSRERMRAAVAHKIPDRVPVDLNGRGSAIEEGAYNDLKNYLGIDADVPTVNFIRSHATISDEILDMFNVDVRYVRSVPSESWRKEGGEEFFFDQWKVPWKKASGSHYFDIDRFIFKDITEDDIDKLSWPELITDCMIADIKKQAKHLHETTDYSIYTDVLGSAIFESAWYLRGFEQFMIDMMVDEGFAAKFLRKVLDLQLDAYGKLLSETAQYIDGIFVTDDLASQESLLMSNELYKKMIQPYQRELIGFIHSKGVNVVYHSCGAISQMLPDLIEAGINMLHPVQLSAKGMDPDILKREYGDKLTFWGGGCNSQKTLQFGSVQEVKDEVKFRLERLASGGGYVFAPEHCIQSGTPPRNIVAMFETVKEFGVY